ncbi:MAG TPA: hypothetical protein VHU83_12150 [Bryobacteraceae bacterium]|jgi:hypothetical protein|nr:hypothetical protein [Bryobacteraceae bacterium]
MSAFRVVSLLTAWAVILIAADASWENKAAAAWTEDDARQILAESPWAKTTQAMISPLQTEDERRAGGKMGQDQGLGFDGIADDRPRIQAPKSAIDIVRPEALAPAPSQFIRLRVRWESALPIRVAELKSHVVEVLTLDRNGYSIGIYGIPAARSSGGGPKSVADSLKNQAVLKRDGKEDVRPFSVEVLRRDDGPVIVYVFPLSAEISKNDRRIEFEARIGRIAIAQFFDLAQMQFQGKLEL